MVSSNINIHQNLSTSITECIAQTNLKERFISSTGLEETELVWNFLSMVEFNVECDEKGMFKIKSPNGNEECIQPMNFTDTQQNQFAIGMLEAFEEFDKLSLDGYPNGGLITKQFEAIAQKCADKGVKLLIGEKTGNSNVSFDIQGKYNDFYLFVNLSERVVKEQMEKPIYIIQQTDNNIPEIKAIPLRELVGQEETDENKLLAKCTAYLLFHELFHVNTFLKDNEIMDMQYPDEMGNVIKDLFGNNIKYYDDARNTLVFSQDTNRIPGEFELLQALYPDKPTMRLYFGKGLKFYDEKTRNACLKNFNEIFKSKLSNKQLFPTIQQKLNYHIISNMTLRENIKKEINEIKSFFQQDTNSQLLPEQMHYKTSQIESTLYKLNEDLRKQILQDVVLDKELIEDIIDNAIDGLKYLKKETNEKTNPVNIFEGAVNKQEYVLKLWNLVKFEQEILKTKLDNIEQQLQQLNALTTFQTQSNENLEITVNESILKPFEDYSFAFQKLQIENREVEQIKA